MKQFKDTAGKVWTIAITAGTTKRVLDVMGINLGSIGEGTPPLLTRFYTVPSFVAELLGVVVWKQLEKASLKSEDFYELLDEEVLAEARDLLLEELRNFFQKFGPVYVAAAIAKTRELVAEEDARRTAAIQAATLETEEESSETSGSDAAS